MGPVDVELLKIKKGLYQEVKKNKEAALIICLGDKHEIDLLEGFFMSGMSDESTEENIFLMHYQPFGSAHNYGEKLLTEWKEVYHLWQREDDKVLEWAEEKEKVGAGYQTDAYKAFHALATLHKLYDFLKDTLFFVYLAPESVADFDQFQLWVNEWCALSDTSSDIKLVIADRDYNRHIKKNQYSHEWRIKVDVHQLMQNTAAYTNRNKNGTEGDYQQQILIASNCMSKEKYDAAVVALDKAIHIAGNANMQEGQIAAMFMLTQCYSVSGKKQKAEETFQELLQKVGNNSRLAVQMNMNFATFLLTRSDKEKAIEHYLYTFDMAGAIGDYVMQMECCRIVGQLKDGFWSGGETIKYYERCIDIGKQYLTNEQKAQSSMAYVASLLMKKYAIESRRTALNNEMSVFLGKDWLNKIQQQTYEV